jgi:hypothetical protein
MCFLTPDKNLPGIPLAFLLSPNLRSSRLRLRCHIFQDLQSTSAIAVLTMALRVYLCNGREGKGMAVLGSLGGPVLQDFMKSE